ncbi:MAG: hypothetical protein EKE20_14430 [Candidatus Symbiopectobacterium sp. Dall1.0]|nr:hypothetical protein [Candidatus Symbiopectobacterium sp. Dall1.0]
MGTPNNIHHIKPAHLSLEGFKKLNRSKKTAFNMELLIRVMTADIIPPSLVPDILSYINDDIDAVLQEVTEMGMCNKWLRKETISESTNTSE